MPKIGQDMQLMPIIELVRLFNPILRVDSPSYCMAPKLNYRANCAGFAEAMQFAQNSDMLLPQPWRMPRNDFCLLLQRVGITYASV